MSKRTRPDGSHYFEFTSEADAIAHIEFLTSDVAKLKAKLAEHPTEQMKTQIAELPALRASLASLTTERDALLAENNKLKLDAGDFNKRVCAEVVKLGIRPEAVRSMSMSSGSDKPNATERILAAKGVNSLEELEQRSQKP